MSTKILRNYQINAIAAIYQAWSENNQHVLLQMPTGAGKTVILSEIVKNYGGYIIEIAHRMELIVQLSLALAKNGVYHDILAAKDTVRTCVTLHMQEFKHSYYQPGHSVMVSGVDILRNLRDDRLAKVGLVIFDEAHHVLKKNKWGIAAQLFPNAKGLHLTATPARADNHALGRNSDGFVDKLILGPTGRDLINAGYLCDYRIINPGSDIDMSNVPLTASGDYSPAKLRQAVKNSHIVGDIVEHYIKFAYNKLGLTFVASLECAEETAESYRAAGISAEVISGKTPPILRARLMRQFRNREILNLVNVDILGEGVDVPAIEVVTFARKTESYALFAQQFGRALRIMPGKDKAIIIDHVDNCIRHGLPDMARPWFLDRRDKRKKSAGSGSIQLKTCLNLDCLCVYERHLKRCPQCGYESPIVPRATPDMVDGDLTEVSPEVLENLRNSIIISDSFPRIPMNLDTAAQRSILKHHNLKLTNQKELRELISGWAGHQRDLGLSDGEIYRLFYLTYGIDIMTAQTLKSSESTNIIKNIRDYFTENNIYIKLNDEEKII